MSNNKTSSLDAPKLRIILVVTIILLVGASTAIFWYFRSQLITYAEQVEKDTAAASVSISDVNKLKALKQELEDNQVAVTRAKNIVADSKSYQYQNQIVDDINIYAKKAGVSVTSFAFTDPAASGAQGAAAPAQAPTAATQAPTLPEGLKTVSVSLTLKSPIEYQNIIKFVRYIEANLTKMQVSGVAFSKTGAGSTQVSVDPITVEVYVQ
jgi:hypothetical protein